MSIKKIVTLLLLFTCGVMVYSQTNTAPVVKAVIDSTEYRPGDQLTANIIVESNPGLHGLYFDLAFDSTALEFVGVEESSLFKRVLEDNELLYAVSNKDGAGLADDHLIVSYTLKGEGKTTSTTGGLIKVKFRVKNAVNLSKYYSLKFNDVGVIDVNKHNISGATWLDSDLFRIVSPYAGAYVHIKSPYENQIFTTNKTHLDIVASSGNFVVKIDNLNDATPDNTVNITNNFVLDETVDLVVGFNKINVKLVEASNVNGPVIAEDSVTVYRTPDTSFVKIISPQSHELLNSDRVTVEVASSLGVVTINGETSADTGKLTSTKPDAKKIYSKDIWLREGFNTITAVGVKVEQDTSMQSHTLKYTDTIQVYYKKDSGLFKIVNPIANESYKSGPDQSISIMGEIGSMYKDKIGPGSSEPEKNTVTLRATFHSSNPAISPVVLINDEQATITEGFYPPGTDNYVPTARYIFKNANSIKLDGLDNGRIEIVAYKNKVATTWDNAIHRTIYVDNNRLWIDLVQPNVYTSDLLDSKARVINFNENSEMTTNGGIALNDEGAFTLQSSSNQISEQGLTGVTDLIETPDKTLYAIVNSIKNSKMTLYRKMLGESSWNEVKAVNGDGLYGYKLAYTNNGILIGTSNLFSNTNSGLYLLDINDNFVNLELGEPLDHIQFVENRNGKIYLYGNYYQYLYSFNIYSVEKVGESLKVMDMTKTRFENTSNIKQFVLANDATTAVVVTDAVTDNVHFYKRESGGFIKELILDKNQDSTITGQYVVAGEYTNGDYITYLVISENNSAEIIMESKSSGIFLRNDAVDFTTTWVNGAVESVGFADNKFVFLYKGATNYMTTKGQVFFGTFYPENTTPEQYQFAITTDLSTNYRMALTSEGYFYTGIGELDINKKLYHVNSTFAASGSAQFKYFNEDIDELNGFSFEVAPNWLDLTDCINLGFKIMTKNVDASSDSYNSSKIYKTGYEQATADLKAILNSTATDRFFEVTRTYDAALDREIIHFSFNRKVADSTELTKIISSKTEKAYIDFNILVKQFGGASPSVHNLRVYKKIKAKVAKPEGNSVTLPIQGYVYDRTVKEVNIDSAKVTLGRDGSFYYNYVVNIDSETSSFPVTISAQNGKGDIAEVRFTVEVVRSVSDIGKIQYKRRATDLTYLDITSDLLETTSDVITLKGEYFGLVGLITGYELYDTASTPGKLLGSGRFDGVKDKALHDKYVDALKLGSGYEAGSFTDQTIELFAGKQKLVLFTENPGGARTEFTINGNNPVIYYNMSEDAQNIEFPDIKTTKTLGSEVLPHVAMTVHESREGNTPGVGPYKFSGGYEISGKVNSLYKFSDLIIKSYSTGLTFANGKSEMLISVDETNKFNFLIDTLLTKDEYQKDFIIEVVPTIPFLSHLKKKLVITATKSYLSTEFIPDFTPVNPSNWTEEERKSLDIPILFTLNRDDFPVKGQVDISLKVNFAEDILGKVEKFNDINFGRLANLPAGVTYYCIKDNNGKIKSLTSKELKEGVNRIAWSLTFSDINNPDGNGEMSSSYKDRPGMNDHIFSYADNSVISPTVVTMSEDLKGIYYDSTTLPKLNIVKDGSTKIKVSLNGSLIKEDDGTTTVTSIANLELIGTAIKEGKNSLVVSIDEKNKTSYEKQFIFLYDNKVPVVKIESSLVTADFTMLTELTAIVEEANYARAYLHHGNRIINLEPALEILGEEQYRLTWASLEPFTLDQNSVTRIEVRDLAGKSSFALLTKYENKLRPEEVAIVEKKELLPEYNKEPLLPKAESDKFSSLTRFAPRKYPAFKSIKTLLRNNGNKVVNFYEDRGPVYWSKMENGATSLDTGADIANNVPYLTSSSGITSVTGIYGGSGLKISPPQSSSITLYPLGEGYNPSLLNKDKYTLSFWSLLSNISGRSGSIRVNLGDNRTSFINLCWTSSGQWAHDLYIKGVKVSGSNRTILDQGYLHTYILVDKNKGLLGDKSIRVFLGGTEILNSTSQLTLDDLNIEFITGSSSGGAHDKYIDNLKVWDYIVSENQHWESTTTDPENALAPSNIAEPVYYSFCDTLDDITNPIISYPGKTPTMSTGWSAHNYSTTQKVVRYYSSSDNAAGQIYPFGPGVQSFNKLIVSFDTLVHTNGWAQLKFKAGNFIFALTDHQNASSPYTQIGYSVGGVTGGSKDVARGGLKSLFLVLDESQLLSNGTKSIRIFMDGVEVFSGNAVIDLTEEIKFEFSQNINNTSVAMLDNIKIWDTIISETPEELYNSIQNKEEFSPDYYSSLDSVDKITTPETIVPGIQPTTTLTGNPVTTNIISSNNGTAIETYIESIYYNGRNDQQKIGSRLIKPYGDTVKDWSKGSIRTSVNLNTERVLNGSNGWWVTSWANLMGDNTSPFYVRIFNDDVGANITLSAMINNKEVGRVNIGSRNNWHDIFVAWDKNGLSDGNTLVVYVDGERKLATTEPLPNLSTHVLTNEMRVKAHAYYAAPFGQPVECRAWSRMDDIKIWDRVVAENPMALESLGNHFDVFKTDYKYLVFKTLKDKDNQTNAPNSKDLLKHSASGIQFSIVGHLWRAESGKIEEYKAKLTFVDSLDSASPANSRVVDDGEYLYYLLDVKGTYAGSLSDAFTTSKAPLTFFTNANRVTPNGVQTPYDSAKDMIVNEGALTIEYNSDWGNTYEPDDVFLVGKAGDAIGSKSYNDIVVYDKNYLEPNYLVNTKDYFSLNSQLAVPEFIDSNSNLDRTIVKDSSTDKMTLSFWFRADDTYINSFENGYDNNAHRILSFRAENDDRIFKLIYKGHNLNVINERGVVQSLLPAANAEFGAGIPNSISGVAGNIKNWNLITFLIDKATETVEIQINDNVNSRLPLTVNTQLLTDILASGSRYLFGAEDEEEFTSGFFSVANVFYIDRLLSNEEITRIYGLRENNTDSFYNYKFSGADAFSSDTGKLKTINGSSIGYLDKSENADYKTVDGSALKASSDHKNYLTRAEGKSNIIFDTAKSSITYDMSIPENSAASNTFKLSPTRNGSRGFYYFGDKNSNYGLKQARWYTVTGEVKEIAANAEARLVLRINGEEQSLKLQKGHFQFIYDNNSNAVPSDVKLFIESKGELTLSSEMSINEGNYTVPETLTKSAVKSNFIFGLAGTVSFWYKPLNANSMGYVNSEVTIFDSELIKVGSTLVDGEAVYYAELKANSNGTVWQRLDTNVKVDYKWQHIQLSYSFDHKVFYLYIDGKVAASFEQSKGFTPFGTLNGVYDGKDNIFIGCSIDGLSFAEGFIDDFYISKYYEKSSYAEASKYINPVTVSYDNTDKVALTVDVTCDKTVIAEPATMMLNHRLKIRALDSYIFDETTDLSADVTNKKAGRYSVISTMQINGYNYKDISFFNIDEKPKFDYIKAESTPIIFEGYESDLKFAFRFDNSHRFESESLLYSGIAAQIGYNGGTAVKTRYLVQDYISQDSSKWLIGDVSSDNSTVVWKPLTADNSGQLILNFNKITTNSNVDYEFRYFYFDKESLTIAANKFASLPQVKSEDKNGRGVVEKATISKITPHDPNGQEYKLVVEMANNVQAGENDFFNDISVGYIIKEMSTDLVVQRGETAVNSSGVAELYYDDVLPSFGQYGGTLNLKYKGMTYLSREIKPEMNWNIVKEKADTGFKQRSELTIDGFNLLYIDKQDMASFYLMYSLNGLSKPVDSKIEVIRDGQVVYESPGYIPLASDAGSHSYSKVFTDIPLGKGENTVKVYLRTEGHAPHNSITVNNKAGAPELVLNNWVDSLISYNNVYFSWKGYSEGAYDSKIQYSYNFDNSGWTTFNSSWRDVRFYNLDEGYHSFKVKARLNDEESYERAVTFFVDINRPNFDSSKITVEKLVDADGVLYGVNLIGAVGAITDASLQALTVNDEYIDVSKEGSFRAMNIPLTKDGLNKITMTAYDKVGNYSDHVVSVDNTLTHILYPGYNNVKYCPLTIVGKIDESINTGMDIYLFDKNSEDRGAGDYSGWKKAKINEDRTFFVEDVFINAGTSHKEVATTLKMAVVFKSGKTFVRDYVVKANQIMMPIELTLSTHAAEGEGKETTVEISAKANVANISSWSIDFNGDGIYDDVYTVKSVDDKAAKYNPVLGDYPRKSWNYTYSSLGIVTPRVRVITKDGNFFSVTDSLIVHEKIKEASNKMINDAISLAAVPMPDNSKRVFVLKGIAGSHEVEVYNIARNDAYITNKLFTIGVTGNGINNPVVLRALDSENLFIADNTEASGKVYQLKANEFGNYDKVKTFTAEDKIKDLTITNNKLYISYVERNFLTEVEIKDITTTTMIEDTEVTTTEYKVLDTNIDNSRRLNITTPDLSRVEGGNAIAADGMGLLVADWFNQRVIRMTEEGSLVNQFGSIGLGEKQFIKPAIIKSYENRIFIFDRDRMDIQVFDLNYRPITTMKFDANATHNYLEPDFFNDIADLEIITRNENGLLYYYALIMSKTKGKLALLRLPQWEELRARVRNNKIVFIQDGEIMTAKPDGSDLTKLLSTDSLPRIEGTLDYPALAPDGKKMVFTSRVKLYNKTADGLPAGNEFAYDNLYTVNIETKELVKVDLGTINGYEIERPVFNSNGDKVIFSAKATGSRWQIYVYDLKGKTFSKLFNSDENARYPYYSPDDRFVVFTTDYDGDEEIEIIDTENLAMRVSVTSNHARDSLPVWSALYPFEAKSGPTDKIESKIAFVSERDFHKGVYYVYISRKSESDVRVVKHDETDIGNDPDSAAIEVTNNITEGDYPCFTGDGANLIFQHFDGTQEILKKVDMEANFSSSVDKTAILTGTKEFTLTNMNVPTNAMRPAGMKNMIVNFAAEQRRGNEIDLKWDRYTDNDIFYIVKFRKNSEGDQIVEKKVFAQDGITLKGLTMGVDYLVQVVIRENGEEVAITQWKKVKMPTVAAIASYEIDTVNPYLVKLKGWKPEPDTKWRYKWLIDNMEVNAEYSQDYIYEFGTSGTKTIVLKTSDSGNTVNAISEPMTVEIETDIDPVIEYVMAEDSSYIELSAENSKGNKIDFASAIWTISGPGRDPMVVQGSKVIAQLNNFTRKINVNLALKRVPIINQAMTDTIQKSMVIDMDLKEVIPVITYEADNKDQRLIKFSGEQSKGNIDWYRARWVVYADGAQVYNMEGVSTFAHQFPETNNAKVYTVSLTVPRRNDGLTQTVSQIVSVDAAPIQPKIDYEIIELKEGGNVVGAKLLLDCTKSTGSSIDFSQARWSVPVAGGYGEQPTQFGPTAIYNLMSVSADLVIEVALTLNRRNGTEPLTVTQMVNLSKDVLPSAEMHVNEELSKSTAGQTVILDVLKSTGPNIEWEKTEWVIDGQPYATKGPIAKIEIPASGEKRTLNYTCTLFRAGAKPEMKTKQMNLESVMLVPNISPRRLSATKKNVYELSVLNTVGQNIDWERTEWYLYDGNENVIQKRGSKTTHAFTLSSERMGYPVMAVMYFKGSSYPFVTTTNIDVEGDALIPIINPVQDESDPNNITFSATASLGSGIDWNQIKWTFGDSSQAQYGAVVNHRYATSSKADRYKVSLTLSRRVANGTLETKTVYKEIRISGDRVKPIIKVVAKGKDYLVLSAEDSEGNGLLLDRASWNFEGSGDTMNYSKSIQGGTILRNNANLNSNAYLKTSAGVGMSTSSGWLTEFGMPTAKVTHTAGVNTFFNLEGGFNANTGHNFSVENANYDNYKNDNSSFTSSNSHTGTVCRRYLKDANNNSVKNVLVTLFVYRMKSDGSLEGESITVNIDVQDTHQGATFE